MSAPPRITLIGFSGTGKSTVAALLARELGWAALDSDQLISEAADKTVPEIFAQDGEVAFRRLESEIFSRLATQERIVTAAGGGATTLAETRQEICRSGLVVCLEATPQTIASRLAYEEKGDDRPLLGNSNSLARISRLKAQRAPLYAQADFTVHTDALTAAEVADEISRWYRDHADGAFDLSGRIDALASAPTLLPPIIDAPGARVMVRPASGEYPAYVAWGALEKLGEYVARATTARRVFLISDVNVLSIWGELAVSSLRDQGFAVRTYAVPAGDASKSLEAAGLAYDWLASERAERRDPIIGLGGGMVTDFAGYVAATYLRGVPLIQAPTSLLGMVDAAIGGKTALNHAGAKNIVGAFYQPRAVVADVSTLATLPRRELVEGFGEVVKHAFIRDTDLLALLEDRLEDLLALDADLMTELVARNIEIKAEIVSADEREAGTRELLNFGHTLGHAFEAAGGYEALLHGEAVSAGMMAAAEIGRRTGVTPDAVVERLARLIDRAGMALRPPAGLDPERVKAALSLDKKIIAGGQRWVLLEEIGRPIVTNEVPADVVEAVVGEFLQA